MTPRLYFDTSVFGGVFDAEFQFETRRLFNMVINGRIKCVYSDLTLSELENAPETVKNFFRNLPTVKLEKVEITEAGKLLAQKYISEKVIGSTGFDDCLHIATATLNKVDYLISWNFRHIVNVFRIRGYNSINIREGHSQLDIRSPKEIIDYENNN
ncbi:MAG: type II toxin-antitoxin system VapC family toxin [Ekhidna sp.]|nr:type II toxin-antitoxin system VapC family toxin [Ekhidna sp.]MBC6409536.1 type II toxin-antitoxin system VapC family toxin [Ekhidna sp.]